MSIKKTVIAITLVMTMTLPQVVWAAEEQGDGEIVATQAILAEETPEVLPSETPEVLPSETPQPEETPDVMVEAEETPEPEVTQVPEQEAAQNVAPGRWEGSKYFLLRTNSFARNGWQEISGNWYYFNATGDVVTGWRKLGNHWYYFSARNGAGEKGKMAKGLLALGDKVYYLNPSNDSKVAGRMLTGWQKVSGTWYYFRGGNAGDALTGWQRINKKWYYLNPSKDTTKRGQMMTGLQTINGRRYFMHGGDNGSMATGWQKVNGTWYYFASGNAGHALTGWQKINKRWYYLDPSKDMSKQGQMWTGLRTIAGRRYYMQPGDAGHMRTGWVKTGGAWYYFASGDAGHSLTGWQQVAKKWYFMNSDGKMKTGWHNHNGNKYYLHTAKTGAEGVMATGSNVNIDGKIWHFTSQGIQTDEPVELIAVTRKIMYAVETGGQVYGNQRYNDFTEAYHNTPSEHAITIGAGQWFAGEAKRLLTLIRKTDPAMFKRLDTASIGWDIDNANWASYRIKKDSAKAKCIVAIIDTPVGRRCQDQLMDIQIKEFFAAARKLGINDAGAQVQYANVAHLGGSRVAGLVVADAKKPYTNQTMYDAIMRRNTGNQVGAKLFHTRHQKVREWINRYV